MLHQLTNRGVHSKIKRKKNNICTPVGFCDLRVRSLESKLKALLKHLVGELLEVNELFIQFIQL